jgi:hypothetical protein
MRVVNIKSVENDTKNRQKPPIIVIGNHLDLPEDCRCGSN